MLEEEEVDEGSEEVASVADKGDHVGGRGGKRLRLSKKKAVQKEGSGGVAPAENGEVPSADESSTGERQNCRGRGKDLRNYRSPGKGTKNLPRPPDGSGSESGSDSDDPQVAQVGPPACKGLSEKRLSLARTDTAGNPCDTDDNDQLMNRQSNSINEDFASVLNTGVEDVIGTIDDIEHWTRSDALETASLLQHLQDIHACLGYTGNGFGILPDKEGDLEMLFRRIDSYNDEDKDENGSEDGGETQ